MDKKLEARHMKALTIEEYLIIMGYTKLNDAHQHLPDFPYDTGILEVLKPFDDYFRARGLLDEDGEFKEDTDKGMAFQYFWEKGGFGGCQHCG